MILITDGQLGEVNKFKEIKMNILTNYTNQQRKEFINKAFADNKRIEKYDNTLYALAENEIVENGEIVIDNERIARLQREEFERQFFNTSLGWVRRKVHMQTGEVWDFLKDIVKPGLLGKPIVTYTPNEDYTNLTQNKGIIVTEQFLQECENQIHKDFYGEQRKEK